MGARRRTWLWALVALALVLGLVWVLRDGDGSAEPGDDAAATAGQAGSLTGRRGAAGSRLDLDPLNAPQAAIAGRVTSADGSPIASATVCATTRDRDVPSVMRREPRCTKTGVDGSYRLEGLVPVPYRVSASAPEHIPATYEDPKERQLVTVRSGATRTEIDIQLERGGVEIKGVIKDVSGGVVENAVVTTGTRGWWFGRSRTGITMTRSDADGRFSLWVEPDELTVVATAEGYAEGYQSGIAPGFTFEVFLVPESVLVGRVVVVGSGEPVAGARVEVNGGRGLRDSVAVTDGEGRFRLDRLQPGRYKPVATSETGYGTAASSVHLGFSETSEEVVIELHPAVTVSAVVPIGETEERCPEGWVRLEDQSRGISHWGQLDDQGTVDFKGVIAGTYQVRVGCQGYVAKDTYDDLVVEDKAVTDLVLPVSPGLAIRGVVVDSDGKGFKDAWVSARAKGGDPRAQQTSSWGQQSEADGAFELAGLLPGTYQVHVDAADRAGPDEPEEVELAGSDKNDLRIVLPETGSIEGRVVDENGKAVAGASVHTRSERWGGNSEATNDDGHFVLPGLRPGEHRVTARIGWRNELRAPGTSDDSVQGKSVTVVGGETIDVELVVESQSGTIAGRVMDPDGAPVVDAFLDAARESDSKAATGARSRSMTRWGSWGKQPKLTDQDGNFELSDLSDGTYVIRAYRKGGGEGLVEHVEVGAKGVTITIEDTATLSGTVAFEGGGAPERFEISARDKVQGIRRSERFFRTNGAWVVDQLPAGKFEVSASCPEGDDKTEVELAEGEDKSNVELTLSPRTTLRGTVVDLDSGEPVSNMRVNASAAAGGIRISGSDGEKKHITDEGGRFEIERAPIGKVRVTVVPRSWGASEYEWTTVTTTIESGSDSVELPPIKMVKRRVKQRERGGDLGFKLKEGEAGVDWFDTPLIVGFIRPDGPAAKTELEVGDEITSVDGKSVSGQDRYLYFQLTKVTQGTTVTLGAGDKSIPIVAGKPM